MGVGWAKAKQDRAAAAAFAQKAERYRRKGDPERAVEICREGLAKFPEHLSGRVTLGWALIDLGHHDEARAELERVLRRAPDNLAAIRGLATLHDRSESAVLDMDMPEGWHDGELVDTGPAPDAHAADLEPAVEAVAGTEQPSALGVETPAEPESASGPDLKTPAATVDEVTPQIVTAAQAAMGDASTDTMFEGAAVDDDLTSVLAGLEADLDEAALLDSTADTPQPEPVAEPEPEPVAESETELAVEMEAEASARAAREAAAEEERLAKEAAAEEERAARAAREAAAEEERLAKEAAAEEERAARAAREAAAEEERLAKEAAAEEERAARAARGAAAEEERIAREAAAEEERAARAAREAAAEEERAARAAREAEAEAERAAADAAREAERLAEEAAAFEAAELQQAAQADDRTEDVLAFADFGDEPVADAPHADLTVPAALTGGAPVDAIAPEVAPETQAEPATAAHDLDLSDAVAAFADAQAEAEDLREVALEAQAAQQSPAEPAETVSLGTADAALAQDDTPLADLDSPLLDAADADDLEAVAASLSDTDEAAAEMPDIDLVSLEPAEEPDAALFAQFAAADLDDAEDTAARQSADRDAMALESALAADSAAEWTPPAPSLPNPPRAMLRMQPEATAAAQASASETPPTSVSTLTSARARQVAQLEEFLAKVRSRRLRADAESVA